MEDLILKTKQLIERDFNIENAGKDNLSEEELLALLAKQVAYYMEFDLELLLSSMYRLDINEQKVKEALSPNNEASTNYALAQLILDRQKQRVYTKQFYKQKPIKDLDKELEY